MKLEHTPGPWKVDNAHISGCINAGGKHVALANFNNSVAPETRVSENEHNANARLIAAAPEMLDALISIVKLHTLPDKTKEIDIAIEAIEKATGKPIDEVIK